MQILQQLRSFLAVAFLVLVLFVATVGSGAPSSANPVNSERTGAQQTAELGQKVKGTAQNIQGKATEITGNITGDRSTQIRGKATQAEGNIRVSQPNSDITAKSRKAEQDIRQRQARPQRGGFWNRTQTRDLGS